MNRARFTFTKAIPYILVWLVLCVVAFGAVYYVSRFEQIRVQKVSAVSQQSDDIVKTTVYVEKPKVTPVVQTRVIIK